MPSSWATTTRPPSSYDAVRASGVRLQSCVRALGCREAPAAAAGSAEGRFYAHVYPTLILEIMGRCGGGDAFDAIPDRAYREALRACVEQAQRHLDARGVARAPLERRVVLDRALARFMEGVCDPRTSRAMVMDDHCSRGGGGPTQIRAELACDEGLTLPCNHPLEYGVARAVQLALLAASRSSDGSWQPVRAWRRRSVPATHVPRGGEDAGEAHPDADWWTGCAIGDVAYDYNVLTTELRERPALLSLAQLVA